MLVLASDKAGFWNQKSNVFLALTLSSASFWDDLTLDGVFKCPSGSPWHLTIGSYPAILPGLMPLDSDWLEQVTCSFLTNPYVPAIYIPIGQAESRGFPSAV